MHSTPATTPMPVTSAAPTVKSSPQPASGHSSRNGESGSSSSSMRSRAISLPRPWWRATYFSPPPVRALACSVSTSASLVQHRLGVGQVLRGLAASSADAARSSSGTPARVPPGRSSPRSLRRRCRGCGRRGSAVRPRIRACSPAAVQLQRLVDDPLGGLDGGVLGQADLGDQVRPALSAAAAGSIDQRMGVGRAPRRSSGPSRSSVFCTSCRSISGLPNVSRFRRPVHGQVQATLRVRVGLHRERDSLGQEVLGELEEAAVLRADQVLDRHARVRGTPARRCRSTAIPSSPAAARR